MATTTNYGWTTPDDTALVKDGAAAIRTLGSSIDTSLNTALGTKKAGLVLLNTTSFSGVSSQSINNVFSSTYRNYKIVHNCPAGSGSYLNLRLRASGTDESSLLYSNATYSYRSGNAAAASTANENANWASLIDNTSNGAFVDINIYNPNILGETNGSLIGNYVSGSVGYKTISAWGSFRHAVSYQADGFTLFFGANATGTIQVYGFNQ